MHLWSGASCTTAHDLEKAAAVADLTLALKS